MNISLMKERITFMETSIEQDEIGNDINSYEPVYSCACTVSEETGREVDSVANTVDKVDVAFTVRYCLEVEGITSTAFRIKFRGNYYDIVSIDHMNYKKKCVKFRCRKVAHEEDSRR